MMQRAEQAGFHVPDARRFAAAERAESERDLARFLVDLRLGPGLGAIERVGDDPENLRGAQLRVPRGHAIVEADDVPAGGEENADDGDKSGVRNHGRPRLFWRLSARSGDSRKPWRERLVLNTSGVDHIRHGVIKPRQHDQLHQLVRCKVRGQLFP